MKRTLIRLLIISCLLAEGGLNSVAQEKKPGPEKVRAEVVFKVIGPKFATGKVVKGAPYSATAITETIQTLSDGNQIIRKNESKLYRDSEGRTRTEQTLETIGKWTADGEAQQSISIYDPVAGVSYSLDPRARAAYKNIIPQKKPATGAQSETLMINGQKVTTYTINGKTVTQAEFEAFAAAKKKREAEEELTARRIKEAPNSPDIRKELEILRSGKPDTDKGQKKTESLGTQTIEGVTAEGTRSTLTIPAGEIGNTLPIEVVDENWYSPELQITVMTKHRDPRSGETTYRLNNINRGEPDRSLFEVPADYTVEEGKPSPKELPKRRPTKEE
ncbi:MAG: hypothetical protein J2P21_12910 [Chloracidobacterium sp.]|nr:hypothetical protein [Chloracidobacterium sp.]